MNTHAPNCPEFIAPGPAPTPDAEGLPYRGSRCGLCYWALYDGDWCQNPTCPMHGKPVGEHRIKLSNDEAMVLIRAQARTEAVDAEDREWAFAKWTELNTQEDEISVQQCIEELALAAIARERARASTTAPTPGQAVAGGETPRTAEQLRTGPDTWRTDRIVGAEWPEQLEKEISDLERRLSASTTALAELRVQHGTLVDAVTEWLNERSRKGYMVRDDHEPRVMDLIFHAPSALQNPADEQPSEQPTGRAEG